MNKVIVTGATSMLGTALIRKLIKEKIQIFAFVRKNSSNISRLPKSSLISVIEINLNEMESLNFIEENIDCFFHFAWEGADKYKRDNVSMQFENIKATLDCVTLCSKIQCKAFVFAGSQGEYGRVQGVISSTQPANPDTAYGISKLCAGSLSSRLCKQKNIRFCHGRIFSTYGINDGENTMISYALNNMLKNLPCDFTECEQIWDYLYCDDCAEAFFLIGEKGKDSSIYNIGSGKPQVLKEFIEIIVKETGTKSKINYGAIPYSPIQVMHLEANIGNLQNDTGFMPKTDFAEGIRKTISSFKSGL